MDFECGFRCILESFTHGLEQRDEFEQICSSQTSGRDVDAICDGHPSHGSIGPLARDVVDPVLELPEVDLNLQPEELAYLIACSIDARPSWTSSSCNDVLDQVGQPLLGDEREARRVQASRVFIESQEEDA